MYIRAEFCIIKENEYEKQTRMQLLVRVFFVKGSEQMSTSLFTNSGMRESQNSQVMNAENYPPEGEIINIHGGEAGIQLGNAIWELYCIEHGIRRDGILCHEQDPYALHTFFAVWPNEKCVPRTVFFDTESCIVDEVRSGPFRHLFNPKQLISGKEDAANCFAKGYLTVGREMVDAVLERIRICSEECSRFQGFMIHRSVGGGTGSGMMCYLLEQLNEEYQKASAIEVSAFPSPKLSSVIVEPYNAMLATHSSMPNINCSLVFDNSAVYEICDQELDISSPRLHNINAVIGQVMSGITAQFRFEGDSSVNLKDFQTNLVPYPRIHFPLVGYAPFPRPNHVQHENYTVTSITNACFETSNQMVKCNSKNGKYISCCLLYRGDISTAEINATIATIKMKKSLKFVGVNFMPPVAVPGSDIAAVNRACVMIANNTAIQMEWEKLNRKFDLMYAKKAFIHWYLSEGLEESDFLDTRMDMQALVSDYKEVESEM